MPVIVAGLVPIALLALLGFGAGLQLLAWRPPLIWSDQFGTANSANGITGMAVNSDGFYAMGFQNASSSSNSSPIIRRYDLGGTVAWTRMIENTKGLTLYGISVDAQGLFVVGNFISNASSVLLRFDLDGNQLWSSEFEGRSDVAVSAYSTGVYIAGDARHPLTNQSFTGYSILFVREYDFAGNILWTNEFSNSSELNGIYAWSSGFYVITSNALLGYDPSGNLLWMRQIGYSSISADDSGIYVSRTIGGGTIFSVIRGFLAKYSFDGGMLWNATFDSPDATGVGDLSISTGPSGVYVSSVSVGGNWFVEKYNSNGSPIWSFHVPIMPSGPPPSFPQSFPVISVTGGFYVAGSVWMGGGSNALVQEFSSDNSLVFFGMNPPWSFFIIGGVVAAAVAGVFVFREQQRKRKRAQRIGVPEKSLPAKD